MYFFGSSVNMSFPTYPFHAYALKQFDGLKTHFEAWTLLLMSKALMMIKNFVQRWIHSSRRDIWVIIQSAHTYLFTPQLHSWNGHHLDISVSHWTFVFGAAKDQGNLSDKTFE